MKSRIDEIIKEINKLEDELIDEFKAKEEEFSYHIKNKS